MDTLLFYINAINGGGAERVILQLAHHFANIGYRSILVTSFVDSGKEYDVPENVIRLSIEQEEIKQSRVKRNFSRIISLRKIIKSEHPIAIVSFMAEPNFRAIIATIGIRIKNIISVRNDPKKEYAGKLGRFVGKIILPLADGCVFQTDEAKSWFPLKLQNKSRVILNDVKEEFFNIKRQNVDNIVSVGRLSKQKNHALLIDAFAEIAHKYPRVKLIIYGSGILEDSLRKQIKQLEIEQQVVLFGATSNVPDVLSRAKVFVLSSDYEGMPNCLMEALAAGVPCVSTDCPCGGPRALITNDENGILIPVGNKSALAEALDHLLSDTDYSEKLGQNAKIRAQEFHPNKIFMEWKSFVEAIIANN